jgi:F-type H+-transporting ATPase subunit epsilon
VIFVRHGDARGTGPRPPFRLGLHRPDVGTPFARSTVANPFRVEIVSVESRVWSGEADMLVARTTEGELAVLAGHAPLLGQLKEPSRVRVRTGDEEVSWDITGGFLSVTEDGVTVLAEHAQPASGDDPAQILGQAQAAAH